MVDGKSGMDRVPR